MIFTFVFVFIYFFCIVHYGDEIHLLTYLFKIRKTADLFNGRGYSALWIPYFFQ